MKRLAMLAMFLGTGAMAQETTIRLAPVPLEIPHRIGPLVGSAEPHRYEPAALGVSYQYNMPGAALTVYVYDNGLKDLPDGPDTIPVCHEFESAKQGVLEAYQGARLVSQNSVKLLPPEQAPLMREARLEFSREGRDMISFVWVTTVAKHFLKVRFSLDQSLRDEVPQARRAILETFGTAMKAHVAPEDPEAQKAREAINVGLSSLNTDLGGAELLYGVLLSTAVKKDPGLAPACGGQVVPDFATELGLYQGMLELDAVGDSKFGQQVGKIIDAGFLEEFVWVELHRESWGESPPEGLALREYKAWKKKNLKRFKRPELGVVNVGYPRPLPPEPDTAY